MNATNAISSIIPLIGSIIEAKAAGGRLFNYLESENKIVINEK